MILVVKTNIFSILMSITVVASKGYLVAYSIHRPSFAFNYLTITADSFNLFASATWLFVALGGMTDNPLTRHPFFLIPCMVGLAASAVRLAIFVFSTVNQ